MGPCDTVRRFSLRVIALLVAALVLGPPLVMPDAVRAATLTVNSTGDDAQTCAVAGTLCLRNAVTQAASGDTITFGAAAFPAGTNTILTLNQTLAIPLGVTIQGPGSNQLTIRIAPGSLTDVLNLPTAATGAEPVTVSGVTLSNGASAIAVRAGRMLTVTNSTLANSSNGIYNVGMASVTNTTFVGVGTTVAVNPATVTNSPQSGMSFIQPTDPACGGIVSSTADDGPCTLRAIVAAEPGSATVSFDPKVFPAGKGTKITLSRPLDVSFDSGYPDARVIMMGPGATALTLVLPPNWDMDLNVSWQFSNMTVAYPPQS